MSILAKDLSFLESYPVLEKTTKKVQKVVFPNPIQFGVGNFTTASLLFSNALYFKISDTNRYTLTEDYFGPSSYGQSSDLGRSGIAWGTVYATSGNYAAQVDGRLKHYKHYRYQQDLCSVV